MSLLVAAQHSRGLKRSPLTKELDELCRLPALRPVRIEFYKMSNDHPILHLEYVSEVEQECARAESYLELRKEALQRFESISNLKRPTTNPDGASGSGVVWQLEWKDLDDAQYHEMSSILRDLKTVRNAFLKAYDTRFRKQLAIRKKLEEEQKGTEAKLKALKRILREDGAKS